MITKEQLSKLKNGDLIYGFTENGYVTHYTFVGDIHYPFETKHYAIYNRGRNKIFQIPEDLFRDFFLTEKDALRTAIEKSKRQLAFEEKKINSRIDYLTERLEAANNDN